MTTLKFIEKSQEWVSVRNALPVTPVGYQVKNSYPVLVSLGCDDWTTAELYYCEGCEDGELTWYDRSTECELTDVTHWMSLPALPEWEGTNE